MVNVDLSELSSSLQRLQWMMSTAESCTGGMIAAHCTDLAGSSAWFERGFVTYSNAAKAQLLGVPAAVIDQHGAVSEPVALAMALGACYRSQAQVSVAVTGIAGPTGGSEDKPVGTVWVAWCIQGIAQAERHLLTGDRSQIRQATTQVALQGLLQRLPR